METRIKCIKKSQYHKLFSLFGILLFISSCEDKVELDIENFSANHTVNCLLTSDSVVSLQLSMSKQIDSDKEFLPIMNAAVSISNSDSLWVLNPIDNGFYVSSIKPIEGKSYALSINSNNTTLSASTKIPIKPVVNITAVIDERTEEELVDSYDTSHYSITIIDHPERKEYYWISVKYFKTFEEYYKNVKNISANRFFGGNTNIEEDAYYKIFPHSYSYYIRIDDELLEGDSINFNIKYSNAFKTRDRITMVSADQHLDLYLKSALLQYEQKNLGDNLAFYIPEMMYTNINNGVGIFGSYNSVYFDFDYLGW